MNRASWDVQFFSLAIVFLLILHVPLTNYGALGLDMYLNLAVLLTILPALFLGFSWQFKDQKLKLSTPFLGLFLFSALLSIPLLWAVDLSESIFRVLSLWFGLFLLVMLEHSRVDHKVEKILFLIVTASLIQSIYGFFQIYFIFPNADSLGIFISKDTRPNGSFAQVNVLASFVATGLVSSLYLLRISKSRFTNYLCCFTPIVTLPLLELILSRSSIVGVLLGCLFLGVYCLRTRWLSKLWLTGFFVGMLISISMYFYQLSIDGLGRSLSSITTFGGRLPSYIHLVKMIFDKPLFGWGYGSFDHSFLFDWYSGYSEGVYDYVPVRSMSHPHNEILYWAMEAGVIFFIAPLLLLVLLLGKSLLKSWNAERWLAIACIVPLLVHSQLELPFYHSTIHWIMFILLFYVVFNVEFSKAQLILKVNDSIRLLSAVFAFLSLVVFATGIHTRIKLNEFNSRASNSYSLLLEVKNPFLHTASVEMASINSRLASSLIINEVDWVLPNIKDLEDYFWQTPSREQLLNITVSYYSIGDIDKAEEWFALGRELYFGLPPFPIEESIRLDEWIKSAMASG